MVGSVACGAAVNLSKSTGDGSEYIIACVLLQQWRRSATGVITKAVCAGTKSSSRMQLGFVQLWLEALQHTGPIIDDLKKINMGDGILYTPGNDTQAVKM